MVRIAEIYQDEIKISQDGSCPRDDRKNLSSTSLRWSREAQRPAGKCRTTFRNRYRLKMIPKNGRESAQLPKDRTAADAH